MLLVLSEFSTRKPQSTFENQYTLEKYILKLFHWRNHFKVKQQWKLMGTVKFFFLSAWYTTLFSHAEDKGVRYMDHAKEQKQLSNPETVSMAMETATVVEKYLASL